MTIRQRASAAKPNLIMKIVVAAAIQCMEMADALAAVASSKWQNDGINAWHRRQ